MLMVRETGCGGGRNGAHSTLCGYVGLELPYHHVRLSPGVCRCMIVFGLQSDLAMAWSTMSIELRAVKYRFSA